MISLEQIKLIRIWKKELFQEFSISQIMNFSGKKTKTWTFNTLKMLVKKKVLNCVHKGNLDLYSLNLNNILSFQLLEQIELQENLDFLHQELISKIVSKVPPKNYSLLVFGSYAENKQSKNSDLDLCFLVESKPQEDKIKPYLNEVSLEFPLKIDAHFILFSDFVEMLLREEENLGKQIFRKHKIFYNSDIYYQCIKEAYKRGFRS